jgi:hypothetical protein
VMYRVVDGRAQRAKVEVGQRRDGKAEILQGISATDTIVLAGWQRLREGAPVRAAAGGPAGPANSAANVGATPASTAAPNSATKAAPAAGNAISGDATKPALPGADVNAKPKP